MSKPNRNITINMRTTPNEKQRLQLAAELAGFSNLTNFIMTTMRREVNTIMKEFNTTYLSAQDWQKVNEVIENPPEPNEELIKLLKDSDRS